MDSRFTSQAPRYAYCNAVSKCPAAEHGFQNARHYKGPFSPLMHCAPWYFRPEFRVTRNYRILRSKFPLRFPEAFLGILFILFILLL